MKELCEPEDDEGFMPFMRKFISLFYLIIEATFNFLIVSNIFFS